MTTRIKVRELMEREGLKGEVVNLFPSWHTGTIHGDDGYVVTFSDDSLVVGFSYGELSPGLRVSYGVFFATGAKVPTAINMQSVRENQTERADGTSGSSYSATGRVRDDILRGVLGHVSAWVGVHLPAAENYWSRARRKINDGRSDLTHLPKAGEGHDPVRRRPAIASPQVRVVWSGVSRPLLRSTCQLSDSRGLTRQGGCERPPVVSRSISWKWRSEWLGRFPW